MLNKQTQYIGGLVNSVPMTVFVFVLLINIWSV